MNAPAASPHYCHALGCGVVVPPSLLLCRRHWFLLPKPMRRAVWQAYRAGQERDKNPSREYVIAAVAAINYVAAAEGSQHRLPFPPAANASSHHVAR